MKSDIDLLMIRVYLVTLAVFLFVIFGCLVLSIA